MQHHYNDRYIKRDNIDLWTETFGKPEDPAILLISGAMAPARFWTDEFCNYFANQGFFVIRFDHRDTGLSSPIDYAKNPYDIDDLGEDVIAILDAYNLQDAHLIGHSMGAMIAQFCALKFPERRKSITIISGKSLKEPSLLEAEQDKLKQTWGILLANKPTLNYEESVEGFLRSYKYLNGTINFDEEMAKAYIKGMYERSKHMYLTKDNQIKAFEIPHNHVRAQERISIKEGDLRKITASTLIIHGQEDYIALPINAKVTAQAIPDSKLVMIPRMGHIFFNRKLEKQLGNLILDHAQSRKQV